MAGNFYLFPKGTVIIRLPRRSSLLLKMILLVVFMMCSIYMSFVCLKQTAIYIKPASVRREQIKTPSYDSSDLTQTEIHIKSEVTTNDPEIVDSNQIDVQIKQELSSSEPSKHFIDPKNIDFDKMETHKKPEILSTEPVRVHHYKSKVVNLEQKDMNLTSDLVNIYPIEQQSHDRRITSLKEAKIQIKIELERTKPIDQHIDTPKIIPSSKRQVQVKPESIRTNLTQLPCQKPKVPQLELPYLHYPVPTNYSRRQCTCTPVRFYVIISMQRSGSKWLESLLNSHINISSNGEIFIDRERSANVSALTNTLDKVYNLDWKHSTKKKACIAAVGFKWMLNQGILENHDEILKYFERRYVSVIFLFRRNLLRRMISLLANRDNLQINGTHKAHVNTKQEADMLASYTPKLNAKLLIPRLKRDSALADSAVESFKSIRHMVLYYEDLVQNNTQKLTEILEFLRLPKRKMSSQHVKIHTRPLSELVKNWNNVHRVLRRSPFSGFLKSD